MIERLYKYGHITEHSKALFSTPKLWFSAPARLNDPFECRPVITFDGTRDDIVTALERTLLQKYPNTTAHSAKAEAVSIFLEGRHRDPALWELLRKQLMQVLQHKIGMCCLSRIPDSILMWSHYGCDHEGYCIEYEAADNVPVFGEAQPVVYSDCYPIIDAFKTPHPIKVERVLLTKYTSWAYEQEWRIVSTEGPGEYEYPPACLKSVAFGARISIHDKSQIGDWVAQRGHGVRFYEASLNNRHFSLHFTEVT
jgi:hypothetical protein